MFLHRFHFLDRAALSSKVLRLGSLVLGLTIGLRGQASPIITEFMASNDATLQDDDGAYSDWIEIHNSGEQSLSLSGWYLSDEEENKTIWQFPAVTLGAGEYLVVFASNEDRVDPASALHTNFKLSAGGEYLALTQPDGLTVATEFKPEYPAQTTDISYGITQPSEATEMAKMGYFAEPTPGTRNGDSESLLILDEVVFSRTSGLFISDSSLTLTGAGNGQIIRYKLVSPSASGAQFTNPTTEDTIFDDPIALIDSVVVRAAVFSENSERRGPITTHHFLRVDTTSTQRVDTFSSQLPIVVFDNHGFGPMIKDEIERPAWLYAFTPGENGLTSLGESPTLTGGLELEVRGQSSSLFPKKSYKWDFVDPMGLKVELEFPGMGKFNEWAIIGPWKWDRSNIRNAFVYGLSNAMGRWAPQTRLVEGFFNADGNELGLNDYVGVYVMTDQLEIESGRVDIEELSQSDTTGEDLTGGYVLEIDEVDEDKYSWETENGFPGVFTSFLLIDSPKIDDLAPEQIDYIKTYVQSMENALFSGQDNDWSNRAYLQYLDRGAWIDYHLINTFVKNVDSFWRGTKFYKDRNQRLVAGPVWDYDRSLGSADPRDNEPQAWNAPGDTDQGFGVQYWSIGWWGLLAQDPEFIQGWFDRWQQLRAGAYSPEALASRVDDLANQIGTAAAGREVAQWPTNLSEHGSYNAEIAHMKDWLRQRGSWIDGMLVFPPTQSVNFDGSITVTPVPNSELIYTLNGADPRLAGGELAPDALRSSGAMTFPAGANIRYRGYNRFLGAWPGTKWSRAQPGNIGAPYQPSPRLVNLSSRARVEGGDNILISGLVINDSDNKWVLLRGIGPSLASFGVADPLSDPVLTIFDDTGEVVAQSTGWSTNTDPDSISDAAESVGAFPLEENSGDSGLLLNLPVGRYSVHVSSASGASGTVLTEAYEIDDIGALLNLSVRGSVSDSANPLIAGFVVTGDQPKRVLVRGVGPSLANYGVTSFLADPKLLIESEGRIIAENDNWHTTHSELITTANQLVGAFELDEASNDAAILVTLPPGIYTAVVSGADNSAGITLVEVYELK